MPQVDFHPLTRADGSATYTDQLFSILAGVNGPVEVQRRDELPEEAAIEVNIRPLSGVGGPRERTLEEEVHAILKSIILTHLYPRTLVQVTLQIVKEPKEKLKRDVTDVYCLPSLVNAAFVALVDSGLPLRTTSAAVLVALHGEEGLIVHPTAAQVKIARGVMAVAADINGNCLMQNLGGSATLTQVDNMKETAVEACMAAFQRETDEIMADTDIVTGAWLRQALQENVRDATARRADT